uniref:Uncharacterized protein n=1 Tax=Picea glauca TaxID=3330 RepID=A0A124GMH0_PICGL|nr:hypothetical protein ABT39_MTgene2473 [Picea glauca]
MGVRKPINPHAFLLLYSFSPSRDPALLIIDLKTTYWPKILMSP